MSRKFFGTDGIRGRVGTAPISADFVLRLGNAYGHALPRNPWRKPQVIIGKDTRISNYMFEAALEAGLVAAGVDVQLMGPMPTPAVAHLTRSLRMDGGNLIAYKRPPYDKGGQIVSIAGGSFKQTTLLQNPATRPVRDVETSMSPEYSEFLYAEGHLYMSKVYASKRSTVREKEYLAVGFGTS